MRTFWKCKNCGRSFDVISSDGNVVLLCPFCGIGRISEIATPNKDVTESRLQQVESNISALTKMVGELSARPTIKDHDELRTQIINSVSRSTLEARLEDEQKRIDTHMEDFAKQMQRNFEVIGKRLDEKVGPPQVLPELKRIAHNVQELHNLTRNERQDIMQTFEKLISRIERLEDTGSDKLDTLYAKTQPQKPLGVFGKEGVEWEVPQDAIVMESGLSVRVPFPNELAVVFEFRDESTRDYFAEMCSTGLKGMRAAGLI